MTLLFHSAASNKSSKPIERTTGCTRLFYQPGGDRNAATRSSTALEVMVDLLWMKLQYGVLNMPGGLACNTQDLPLPAGVCAVYTSYY